MDRLALEDGLESQQRCLDKAVGAGQRYAGRDKLALLMETKCDHPKKS